MKTSSIEFRCAVCDKLKLRGKMTRFKLGDEMVTMKVCDLCRLALNVKEKPNTKLVKAQLMDLFCAVDRYENRLASKDKSSELWAKLIAESDNTLDIIRRYIED